MTGEQTTPSLRVLGLLGGIGSGKSSVARFLAKKLPKPAPVLDADAMVAELLDRPRVQGIILKLFGESILNANKKVSRVALGERCFEDSRLRVALEELLHPAVREEIRWQLEELQAAGQPSWPLLDVPLLLEGNLHEACDFFIFVDTPDEIRCQRACERHGWTRTQWEAREATQVSLATKRAKADAILCNAASPEALEESSQELLATLRALPPRPFHWPGEDKAPPS